MSNKIIDFLNQIHRELATGELVELRSIRDGVTMQFFSDDFEALATWVVQNYENANVYVGVCPRKVKQGTNEAVSRAYWLWADLDSNKLGRGGNSLVNYLLAKYPLPPTMIVSSSGDDGGLHVYWAIDSTTELQRVQKINNEIAERLGSDKVGDPARILRVAGTLNHKTLPPTPVMLAHYAPELVYSLDDAEAMCRLSNRMSLLIFSGETKSYASRSERDYAAIGALIKAGVSTETIKLIFNQMAIGDKVKEAEDEHYIDFTVAKLREAEGIVEGDTVTPALLNKWSIIEKDNCYYRVGADGNLTQLSTFVFKPHVLLEGNFQAGEVDTLLGTIETSANEWPNVALSKKAFNTVDALARELPKATWQWLGKDTDVKRLLPYLLDKMTAKTGYIPVREATNAIGRHGDFFVLNNQVINGEGIVPNDQTPITWLSTGKDFPKIEFTPEHDPTEFAKNLDLFLNNVLLLNDIDVVLACLGWFVASLYKPELEKQGVHMPVLNLFGTRGSGKTTIITDVFQPLIGYVQSRTYDANTTNFVMLSLLGGSNAIPISFSEYRKSSLKDPERLIRYILLAYDSGHDSRGRADQTTVDYVLSAPFTIDGEDAINDPACLERTIQLNLKPETIAEDSPAYKAMQEVRKVNLQSIGYALVKFSLQHKIDFNVAHAIMQVNYPSKLPDRVRRNFSVLLAGLHVFQNFIMHMGYEFNIDLNDIGALFSRAINNVVSEAVGRTRLAVDDFITDVVNFISFNDGADKFTYKYNPDTNVLYIQITSAYNWWAETKRRAGTNVLDLPAIKAQLKERIVPEGEETFTPGNYVYSRKSVNVAGRSQWMYEIGLTVAAASGLDIPDRITRFQPKVSEIIANMAEKK